MLQLPTPSLATAEVIKGGPLKGFPKVTPFNCPVLTLMIEYERTVKRHNEIDASDFEKMRPGYHAKLRRLSKKLWDIADAASRLDPQSMAGATFQIMLANGQPDTMMNGSTPEIMEEADQRFQRLMYRAFSLMAVAVKDFPETREYLMTAHTDPAVKEGKL